MVHTLYSYDDNLVYNAVHHGTVVTAAGLILDLALLKNGFFKSSSVELVTKSFTSYNFLLTECQKECCV